MSMITIKTWLDNRCRKNQMSTHEQATQEVRDAFNAVCRGRVEAAVKAEREACAKVCDDAFSSSHAGRVICNNLAAAIRARGETK